MSKKHEPLGIELRALIVLCVLSIQIGLAIRAGLALIDLLILDTTLIPLMFLRRKACCKEGDVEDEGGAA